MFVKGHPNYNKGGSYKGRIDEREIRFLDFYFSAGSETKGSLQASALKAGYAESTALTRASRIIRRFGSASAADSLNAVGVNKPYLAARLKKVLEEGSDKEIISAARLVYSLLGESTGEGGASQVFNAPVMIIEGMTAGRLNALRGAVPQLSPERLEQLSEARAAKNLENLKKGNFSHTPHSKARLDEESLPAIDVPNLAEDREAEPPAG